jgi:hemoglobin-like flavoprotein
MTPDHVKLIRESWSAVAPIADAAAELFYRRLFEIDPDTRPLVAGTDMARQRGRLLEAMGLVVARADRIGSLVPQLEALGRRHAGYGVRDRHYETVGAALIWTLEQGLGEGFDAETRAAWTEAYALVSGAMRRGTCDIAEAAA